MNIIKAFFEKYLFNFKGIMVSSLTLSAIMFTLILLQPAITNFMIEFYEHVPKRNHEEDVEGGSVVFQKTLKKPTKSTEKTLLISKIDSLEKRISKIESESSGTDLAAYRGTFGDMYGSLNSLFSGIGIVGLIVTILIQIYIHQKENKQISIEKINDDKRKLIFFNEALKIIISDTYNFIDKVKNWYDLTNNSKSTYLKNIDSFSSDDFFDLLNRRIQVEEYFNAYKVYFVDNDIFNCFRIIRLLEYTSKKFCENLNTTYNEQRREGIDLHNERLRAIQLLPTIDLKKEYANLPEIDKGERVVFGQKIAKSGMSVMDVLNITVSFGLTLKLNEERNHSIEQALHLIKTFSEDVKELETFSRKLDSLIDNFE